MECAGVGVDLPLRILRERPRKPVITVDGAFGAPGLELSHWPGNRTPEDLRHELSTGCALAFARLAPRDRMRRAAGARAIVNNHYDTDGVCAAFAVRRPKEALPRSSALLSAAATGDFFSLPSLDALIVDCIVRGWADRERSPLWTRDVGRSMPETKRYERALHFAVDHLASVLDGDHAPWRDLWEAEVEEVVGDLDDLRRCERRDLPDLDLTLWIGPYGARAARTTVHPLSPGRHALFGSCRSDRVAVVTPEREGWTWRLVVSTRSWFDLPDFTPSPRPDLVGLAERLNLLEGTTPEDPVAWRAHAANHPSPELWFGGAEHPDFAEQADCLEPSTLDPVVVNAELRASLEGTPGDGEAETERRRPALLADPR